MKLVKIKGIYHGTYTGADGKTKTVTTRCKEKEQAAEVIKEAQFVALETEARAIRAGYTIAGQNSPLGRKLTMGAALDGYEKTMFVKGRAAKTRHNNMVTLRAWLNEVGMTDASPLALDENHVDNWVNNPKSKDSAGTRRVKMGIIRTFFDFMCAKGWRQGNPANLVEVKWDLMTHEQKEPAHRQPFTKPEIRSLLNHIGDALKNTEAELVRLINPDKPHTAASPKALQLHDRIRNLRFWNFAVQLSHETGLRLGDITSLEWKQFEKAGCIVCWTGKTGRRVEVPASDDVLELVAGIPVEHDRYIFPIQQKAAIDPTKRAYLSIQFKRLCLAAGIKDKSFHCLRHTVASEIYNESDKEALAKKLAESLTVGQIAQLLGHTNTKTTGKYIH